MTEMTPMSTLTERIGALAQLKELKNEDFQDGAPVRYEQMDLFGGSKW